MGSRTYTLLSGAQQARPNRVLLLAALTITVFLGTLWYLESTPTSHSPSRHIYQVVNISTELSGHAAGFKILKNVGYHDRTFYFFNTTMPDVGTIMSGTTVTVVTNDTFKMDSYYPGTTLFLNEGATWEWSGLWHYYHFAVENILGGLAAMATEHDGPVMPDRLIIPWLDNWHDKWFMNDYMVKALFGGEVLNSEDWKSTKETNVFFEELVLVDRWAAHRTDPEVNRWNKMPIMVFQDAIDLGRTGFFDIAKERIRIASKAPPPKGEKIIYIDRQGTDRKLDGHDHDKFVAAMYELAKERKDVGFDHLILENLSPMEQFRRVSQGTIIVGIHGNGLTHLMWMPPKSAVIELFMPLTWHRDYQCAAEVLGYDYTAIRGDAIYTRTEWEANDRPFNQSELHSGKPVEVDVELLIRTVKQQLEKRVGREH